MRVGGHATCHEHEGVVLRGLPLCVVLPVGLPVALCDSPTL